MSIHNDSLVEVAKYAWKKEWADIKTIIENRRIPTLFHFTPLENLESILTNGLIPRDELMQRKIPFKPTDNLRSDGITAGTCFSITKPNMGLLRHKRNHGEGNIAVLECTANTLLLYPFVAFPGNAAGGIFVKDKSDNVHRYIGINGLKNLFLNKELRKERKLSADAPTDNQSEIIFLEKIDMNRILRIHIPIEINPQLMTKYKQFVDESDALNFHFPCDCDFFATGYVPFVGAGRFSFDWFTS
jgi:hypothetical protein